jgi:hypothetical protein
LYRELDTTRGTHAQAERIRIITALRDECARFLKLTALVPFDDA